VTFLPYIGCNFIKEYIIPNYIGESLAALVPSVLALIQGLGQDNGCKNVTSKSDTVTMADGNFTLIYTLEPIPIKPNYSVSLYFMLMFALLCISTCSFTLLNYSKVAIKERKTYTKNNTRISPEPSSVYESNHILNDDNQSSSEAAIIKKSIETVEKYNTNENRQFLERHDKEILLTLIFFVSFICYGVLPGLQSYSTLPYGNRVFNLAVNLSNKYSDYFN
jgi:riboflavin transporter 2